MESRYKNKPRESMFSKIMNKNALPIILFIMIFLNFFTLISLNYNIKTSKAAGTDVLVPAFGIGFIILFFFYIKKIEISKTMIIQFILLMAITVMWSVVQCINVISGNYYLFDIFNIACKFVNVLFLFVLLINIDLNEKYIYKFMKCLIFMGIVACVWNFALYFKDILATLKIISIDTKIYTPKSFFAQKNQFAYFLFPCIISSVILLVRNKNVKFKVLYSLCILLFLFNIVLSASRTGLVVSVLFLGLYLLFNDRMKIKQKVILIAVLGVIGTIGIIGLYKYNPELLLNKLVRADSVKTLTGRTKIWNVALETANENPGTVMFGAGRFKGVEAINAKKLPFTQFHNTYIEFFVSGGIIELIYFISIYIFVFVKILKSNKLNKSYKIIYTCMYVSYFIYMFAESLGRFSIGGSDCLGIIFFVTIPLLHANVIPECPKPGENNKGEDIEA